MKKLLLLACCILSGAPMFAHAKLDALKQRFQQLDPEIKKMKKIVADLKALQKAPPNTILDQYKKIREDELFRSAEYGLMGSIQPNEPSKLQHHIEGMIDKINSRFIDPQREIQRGFARLPKTNIYPSDLHVLELDITKLKKGIEESISKRAQTRAAKAENMK